MMERKRLFGLPFVADVDNTRVLAELRSWPLTPEHPQELPILSTPNVDQVVKLMRAENAAIHQRIQQARYVLPDGQPIVWTSRWKKGFELPSRITGSDLFPALWPLLVKDQRSVYMVLANDAIGRKLQAELPNMRYTVPPFYSITDQVAERAVIDGVVRALNEEPVDYLFLGLGFPKQERLAFGIIDTMRAQSKAAPLMLLLGASFEFYAGFKKRAPGIFQKLGLEFFHRFLTEPRRMFRRYFVDDVAFFRLAWKEVMAK
jgi:N-acetylglucosaminyldiphosphoundecaprenol N-acetyl-beta-D-mannosaminyltransferase